MNTKFEGHLYGLLDSRSLPDCSCTTDASESKHALRSMEACPLSPRSVVLSRDVPSGRHAKRARVIAAMKLELLQHMPADVVRPRPKTPDPWDRSISKRQWEIQAAQWRWSLQAWRQQAQADMARPMKVLQLDDVVMARPMKVLQLDDVVQ